MDTLLIEETNEDYLIVGVYFVSSGKLLRKWNINIMVMKTNLLFGKNVNSIFTHLKVLN